MGKPMPMCSAPCVEKCWDMSPRGCGVSCPACTAPSQHSLVPLWCLPPGPALGCGLGVAEAWLPASKGLNNKQKVILHCVCLAAQKWQSSQQDRTVHAIIMASIREFNTSSCSCLV